MLLRNLNHVVEVLANAKSIVTLVEYAIRSVQTGNASLFRGCLNHSLMWMPTLAPVHAMNPTPDGIASGDGTKHEPGSFLGMPRERRSLEYADLQRMDFKRNLSAHARQSATKRAMRRG